MHIDKYKSGEFGDYIDNDGCHYEDAEDFLQSKLFGFCGCGDPESNLKYIARGLSYIGEQWPGDIIFGEWYAQWVNRGHKIFGNEQSRYFFFYWADSQGLTEHGGAVPGWLTQKGKEVLSDINELYQITPTYQ